jgi:hypothetical protein
MAFEFLLQHCGHYTTIEWEYALETQVTEALERLPESKVSELTKAIPSTLTEGKVRKALQDLVEAGRVDEEFHGGGRNGETTYRLRTDRPSL